MVPKFGALGLFLFSLQENEVNRSLNEKAKSQKIKRIRTAPQGGLNRKTRRSILRDMVKTKKDGGR